jgi:tight adherence protein B
VTLVAALLGAGCGLGAVLIALGLRGSDAQPQGRRDLRSGVGTWLVRGTVGAVAGLVVGLLTGWPVAGLAALAGGMLLPAISRGRRAQRAQMEKTEALPAWCEMLRDTLAGSAHGLETVVKVTAQVAPLPIRADARILASDLTRRSLDDALIDFADRVDDPVCDQVVMGLRLRGSGDLTAVLSSIAVSARREVDLRRRVEAGRSGQRWTARVIIAITLLLAGGIALLHGQYLAAYDSPAGQLMLLVVLGFFAAGLWLMERVTRGQRPARLLAAHSEQERR